MVGLAAGAVQDSLSNYLAGKKTVAKLPFHSFVHLFVINKVKLEYCSVYCLSRSNICLIWAIFNA